MGLFVATITRLSPRESSCKCGYQVTGLTIRTGIGLAIAHYLLGKNTRLVVTARTKEALEKLKHDYPDQIEVLVGDASDFSLGEKATQAALTRWGQINGLVVNHGVLDPVKRVSEADAKEWRDAFDVNFFSAVALVHMSPGLRFDYL